MRIFGRRGVGGRIKAYNLEDWWFNVLTTTERELFRSRFPEDFDDNATHVSSAGGSGFLWGRATSFTKTPEERAIARKMLQTALERAREQKNLVDEHYSLQGLIEIWYRDRDSLDEALDQAIDACKAQIAIAAEVALEFRRIYKGYPTPVPPTHRGYEQLRIIYEKQKRYDDAMALALDKKRTGWADDVSDYIAKMNVKKAKLSSRD